MKDDEDIIKVIINFLKDKSSCRQINHPDDNISRSISAASGPAFTQRLSLSPGSSVQADEYRSSQADELISSLAVQQRLSAPTGDK